MSRYNKITLAFYLVALFTTIASGFSAGFTAGSHTPPVPFLIEVFVIAIGLAWLSIDTIVVSAKRKQTWQDIAAHVAGLSINAGFAFYLALPAFNH